MNTVQMHSILRRLFGYAKHKARTVASSGLGRVAWLAYNFFSPLKSVNKIMGAIEGGVGGILGELALIIGFGSILGKMLEVSGGAERIASTMVNLLGKRNATWAIMLVGFIAGIPVFVEVGFVLLVPLVFVVAKDAGMSRLQVGIPLAVALMVVHCIVPPHPAATAITASLGADIADELITPLDKLLGNTDAESFSEALSQLGGLINAHFTHEEHIYKSLGMPEL